MKWKTPEHSVHLAVVQLLKLGAAPGVVWHHVPNGEARDERTGARLKRMGVRRGVGDIALTLPPHGKAAFLELKSADGRLSPDQREFGNQVIQAGGLYAVAKSIDEAQAVLKGWGALK